MILWEKSSSFNINFSRGQTQCSHLGSDAKITCFSVDGKTKVCDIGKIPLYNLEPVDAK